MSAPYSIGSEHWPGLSKLTEECGEVLQVVGKIIGRGGDGAHWDGGPDTRVRLVEELGDLTAAIEFVAVHNGLPLDDIRQRANDKGDAFRRWHREQA